jgi:hypothetical protein
MNSHKNPNVKGRKFNGSPHLKLKMVKTSPCQKIRQLLRSFVPLDQFRSSQKSEQQPG